MKLTLNNKAYLQNYLALQLSFIFQVWMGSTRKDEMCNFYMMYWVDGPEVMSQS